MAANKAVEPATKKRKAEESTNRTGGSKKARHGRPMAYVKLPHSPGGTTHGSRHRSAREDGEDRAKSEGEDGRSGQDSALQIPEQSQTPKRAPTQNARSREARRKARLGERDTPEPEEAVESGKPNGAAEIESELRVREERPKPSPEPVPKPEKLTVKEKANRSRKKKTPAEEKPSQDSDVPKELVGDTAEEVAQTGRGTEEETRGPEGETLAKPTRKEQKKSRRANKKEHNQAMDFPKDNTEPAQSLATRAPEVDAMQVDSDTDDHHGWSFSAPSGGRFIDQDPIFVRHPESGEEMLIAATHREVQTLSLATSLAARSCTVPEGCEIQCITLGRHDDRNMLRISCHGGTQFVWDWVDGAAAESTAPLKHAAKATVDAEDGLFSMSHVGGSSFVSLGGHTIFSTPRHLEDLQVLADAEYVIAYGQHAIIVGRKKSAHEKGSHYTWIEVPVGSAMTCADARLAFGHDTDRRDPKRRPALSIAIGNQEGQIMLYDDITSVFSQHGLPSLPTPRILHWHREAVSAVTFSKDGNYLISGGKETVLVLWQLETGKKQFLPHLTSEIERIVVSTDGDKYAVQMGDNSIMVLSTSELKPVANFAGLQLVVPPPSGTSVASSPNTPRAAAVLDPHEPTRLLLTVPATQPRSADDAASARPFLQTFDLRTSRHVTRQALTRNNVTDFNLGPERTPIVPPDVAHVAISHDGQWLATVDTCLPPASDVEYLSSNGAAGLEEQRRKRREVYLKLWQWDAVQGLWTLSTRVDAPHARAGAATGARGAGQVWQLLAEPTATGFATVGEDGCVKIWKPRSRVRSGVVVTTDAGADIIEWTCRRTIELPATTAARAESALLEAAPTPTSLGACLAFSEDGSVLAVGHSAADADERPVVHFVDPVTGIVSSTTTISGLDAHALIAAIAFLDRHFVIVSQGVALVSDLVSGALRYRFYIPAGDAPMLATRRAEGTFAIAVGDKLGIYKPTETQAVYTTRCAAPVAAVLGGTRAEGYTLLFENATIQTLAYTGALQHMALGPATDNVEQATEERAAVESAPEVPPLLGQPAEASAAEQAEDDEPVLDEPEDDRPVVRPEQLARIFDVGQSFALPPVKDMFDAVVGLFGRRPHAAPVPPISDTAA